MAGELCREKRSDCAAAYRVLRRVMLGYFGALLVLLVILYVAAPSLYVQALQIKGLIPSGESHPLPITLFLIVILTFVTTLGVGVVRGWRWLFWPALIAFLVAPLEILAGILQLLNVIPVQQPVWYVLLRMATPLANLRCLGRMERHAVPSLNRFLPHLRRLLR